MSIKIQTKKCTGCEKWLPIFDFYADRSGYRCSPCKACMAARARKRYAKKMGTPPPALTIGYFEGHPYYRDLKDGFGGNTFSFLPPRKDKLIHGGVNE